MSSLPTDWRNYSRGIPPEDWAGVWTAGGPTCRVSGTDLEPADSLEIFGESVTTLRALSWTIWDNQTGRATQAVRSLVYIDTAGTTETPLIFLRLGGTAGAENGYYIAAGTTTLVIRKLNAGVSTQLNTSAFTMTAKRYWWVYAEATGTTIHARAWAYGSADPGGWTVTTTDATFADGKIGVGVADAFTVVRHFFLSVGINGTVAPDESALSPRLRDALLNPAVAIEYWLRLSYTDPATGIIYTRWCSQLAMGRTTTGDLDFPPALAAPGMLPILSDPGSQGWTLSVDNASGGSVGALTKTTTAQSGPISANSLFAGSVTGAGSFEIHLNNQDGLLAFLAQPTPGGAPTYTLSGLRQTIYAGVAYGPTRGFEPIGSATCATEPIMAADFILQMASDEERLGNQLTISHYAGVRTCQNYNGGSASAPHLAAYDLVEFTVMGRIRSSASPAAAQFLINKSASNANRNFALFVDNGAGQSMQGRTSSGGVAGFNICAGGPAINDGKFHSVVYAVGAAGPYLMVDGIVVGTSTYSTPDVQNTPVVWGTNFALEDTCDQRIYNYCMTQDEARTALESLGSVAVPGLVAAWVGDDGVSGSTPTTVTDYGSGANNATITGTFTWQPSDLGDASQIGKLRPLAVGLLRQAPPDRSDPVRSRYTYTDALLPNSVTSRSRGAVLTRGADNSNPPSGGTDTSYQGGGVFLFAGANPDPVTVDFLGTGSPLGDTVYYAARLAKLLSTTRGTQILHKDIDNGWCEAMARLAPYPAGFWRKGGGQAPTETEVWTELLGGSGQAWRLDRDDRIAPCQLLPSVLPSPYNNGADYTLEFCGHPRTELIFPSITIPAGSFTICGWTRCFQPEADLGQPNTNATFPTLMSMVHVGGVSAPVLALGLDPYSQGQLISGWAAGWSPSSGFPPAQGGIPWSTLTFFAAVFAQGTGWSFYAGLRSGVLVPVFTVATGVTFPGGTGDLRIGCGTAPYIGSLQHVQIWSAAKDARALQLLMATPPIGNESGLVAYVPLTEPTGPPIEVVSGKSARWGNIRRSPRLVLDYTASGQTTGTFGGAVAPRPAYEAVVSYNTAEQPLQEADIALTVTGAARQSLKEVDQKGRFYSLSIRYDPVSGKGYRQARSIAVASPYAGLSVSGTPGLSGQVGSSVLAKLIGYRFSPARIAAQIQNLQVPLALDLRILDEVLVKAGPQTALPAVGVSFRIVQLLKTFLTGKISMGLWR